MRGGLNRTTGTVTAAISIEKTQLFDRLFHSREASVEMCEYDSMRRGEMSVLPCAAKRCYEPGLTPSPDL